MKNLLVGLLALGSISAIASVDYKVKAGVVCAKNITSLNREIEKKTQVGSDSSNRAVGYYGNSPRLEHLIVFTPKDESKVEISAPSIIGKEVCVSISVN